MKKLLLIPFLWAVACFGQITISPTGQTVTGIAITVNPSTIAIGQTSTLKAQLQLADGTLNTDISQQCSFASASTSVATVSGRTATGVSGGTSVISCTNGTLTGSATLTVASAPVITNPPASCTAPCSLPAGTNGVAHSYTFAATGGVLPYTWTNSVGTPPTGLSLSSAGVLSGTPSVNGTTTWTVKVADATTAFTTLQVSMVVAATAGCGTPPNYCARQDTNPNSGATVNVGKPPAALMGLTCASPGHCGTSDCVLDDNNSGPAQGYLCRITDFNMAGAGNTNNDNSSSTTRQWNALSNIYSGVSSSNPAFFSVTAGSPPTITAKGTASQDKNGLQFPVGINWSGNACSNPTCGTTASTSHLFYGSGGNGGFPTRNTLNKYVLDTTCNVGGTCWTGSAGMSQDLSAAITGTVLLDPINCPGLTTYLTGTDGAHWNRWIAAITSDQSADKNDHVSGTAYRYSQDNGSLIVLYDSTQTGSGCRWLDLQTGTVGGDYGPTGSTTGFGPMAPPATPTATLLSTGGSLACASQYTVGQTYVLQGKSANPDGGESTLSSTTTAGPNGSGSSCSLSISPPVTSPGGISLSESATGYNNYACAGTSCTPTLQSPYLSQPTNVTATGCTTGTSSNTVTYWVVAKNGTGASVTSAPLILSAANSTAVTSNVAPGCTVSWNAVPGASSYDVLRDDVSIRACGGTTNSCKDTTQNPVIYANQTTPISASAVIGTLATTGPSAPSINYAAPVVHNWRMDESGQYAMITIANAFAGTQGSPVNGPMEVLWPINGVKLIPSNPLGQTAPYLGYGAGHWTHGYGTMVSWVRSILAEGVFTTLSSDAATMDNGQVFLNAANGTLDTQSGDQHLSGSNSTNTTPQAPIFRNGFPTQNAYALPSVPYHAEVTAWQLPVAISSVSRTSNVTTVTTSTVHNLQSGDNVTLLGVTDNSFNGTASNITVTGTTTFTFAQTAANASSSAGTVDRPMMRFCHTWTSAAQGSSVGQPRGGVSQDGKWMVFESDMLKNSGQNLQGTASVGLGCKDGTTGSPTACSLGATSANNARWDLYVCQLK